MSGSHQQANSKKSSAANYQGITPLFQRDEHRKCGALSQVWSHRLKVLKMPLYEVKINFKTLKNKGYFL